MGDVSNEGLEYSFSILQKGKTEACTYQATCSCDLRPALPTPPNLILQDFVVLELRVRPRTDAGLKPRQVAR